MHAAIVDALLEIDPRDAERGQLLEYLKTLWRGFPRPEK